MIRSPRRDRCREGTGVFSRWFDKKMGPHHEDPNVAISRHQRDIRDHLRRRTTQGVKGPEEAAGGLSIDMRLVGSCQTGLFCSVDGQVMPLIEEVKHHRPIKRPGGVSTPASSSGTPSDAEGHPMEAVTPKLLGASAWHLLLVRSVVKKHIEQKNRWGGGQCRYVFHTWSVWVVFRGCVLSLGNMFSFYQ